MLAQPPVGEQVSGQLADPPVQANGAQEGAPALPGAAGLQVPSAGAPRDWRQVSHAPAHAALQQTPSTQRPDWHCAAEVHACPFGSCSRQAPAWQ